MKPSAQKDCEVQEDKGVPKAENIIWPFFKLVPSDEHNFAREADN